jgi:D-sedoheptulose 7-phosphate isomerase
VSAIQSYIDGLTNLIQELPQEDIQRAIDLLLEASLTGHAVYIMGNGGSAATASHMANDLAKGTLVPGAPGFKAMALTDNVPLIMAWANDTEYANVFVKQLAPWVEADDVVIGISGSGNSENVLRAIDLAQERGAKTIGFTGYDGGKLAGTVDVSVNAEGAVMEMAEDVHMILDHLMVTVLRSMLKEQLAAESG